MTEQQKADLEAVRVAAFTVFRASLPVWVLALKEALDDATPVSGDALSRGAR